MGERRDRSERTERPERGDRPDRADRGDRMDRGKRSSPPEQTNAENFYYIKQMQARTPMVVVLDSGEIIRGVIEWYDKNCIKVHRAKEPNLLIMKSFVRYMYKQTEAKDDNSKGSNGDEGFLPDSGHE